MDQDVLKEVRIQREVSQRSRTINYNFNIVFFRLSMSLLLPILSWFGVLKYDENIGTWFSRSGSLMVLFALLAEVKLFKIDGLTKPVSENGLTYADLGVRDQLYLRYSKPISRWKFITMGLAVCGTIIWGYGDLIWKFFH